MALSFILCRSFSSASGFYGRIDDDADSDDVSLWMMLCVAAMRLSYRSMIDGHNRHRVSRL